MQVYRRHDPTVAPLPLVLDFAFDRLRLVRHVDAAHAAFADCLEQLVLAGDDRADRFGWGRRCRLIRPGEFGRHRREG